MANTVSKSPAKKPVSKVAVKPAAAIEAKTTPADRLAEVLVLIDRDVAATVKPESIKYGKAIPLLGGGSVYINRSNADVRATTGQVAALAKTIPGATVRGPQGQYLRIPFTK